MIFQHYSNNNIEKLIKKEVKNLKEEQKSLLKNEKQNFLKIDSINSKIDSIKIQKLKIIENNYFTKEVINNKLKKDEEISNYSNVNIDTLQKFLSEYRHKPYKRTSN
jgi:hypothetical protein